MSWGSCKSTIVLCASISIEICRTFLQRNYHGTSLWQDKFIDLKKSLKLARLEGSMVNKLKFAINFRVWNQEFLSYVWARSE